jgi:hypothetical protein
MIPRALHLATGLVVALCAQSCAPAQTPAARASGLARYQIDLEYRAVKGLIRCDGALQGADSLVGVVSGDEISDPELIVYRGVLSRATQLGYCESYRPVGSEDVWCTPVLTGSQAKVDVTISVFPDSGQWVDVEIEPRASSGDVADVSGACTPEMEAAIRAEYLDSDQTQIEPPSDSALVHKLAPGVWQDVVVRPPNQPDGWTLTVRAAP